jgi:hypothetical protein
MTRKDNLIPMVEVLLQDVESPPTTSSSPNMRVRDAPQTPAIESNPSTGVPVPPAVSPAGHRMTRNDAGREECDEEEKGDHGYSGEDRDRRWLLQCRISTEEARTIEVRDKFLNVSTLKRFQAESKERLWEGK